MKRYAKTLLRCPLFRGMDEGEILRLLGCLDGRKVIFGKGAILIHEWDRPASIGIEQGRPLQGQQQHYYGNRTIMAHVTGGELFGESFACAQAEALPVSVAAVESGAALLLDCRRIIAVCHNACDTHRRLILNLMQVMAEKNLLLQQKLQVTSQRTTREKLLAYLDMQARLRGSRRFTIPFRRQELAAYLRVDRSGLSTEIGKLKAEGVIDCCRSTFELLLCPGRAFVTPF